MAEPAAYRPPPTFDALGVRVAALNPDEFLAALDGWHRDPDTARGGAFINFRDVHGVVRAWEDPALAAAHEKALFNAPDGKPLAWIGRRRGYRNTAQVCGPDMMPAVCRYGVSRGWRHTFYGSTPEVLSKLRERLQTIAPGLQVVDEISPPFRPLSAVETEEMRERIRSGRPHFVWVGIGSPKQEIWMSQNAEFLPGSISHGRGRGVRHAAPTTFPRAALWMRNLGLEWLSRALQEPRRLGSRYAKVVPRFLWRAFCVECVGLWRTVRNEFSRQTPR